MSRQDFPMLGDGAREMTHEEDPREVVIHVFICQGCAARFGAAVAGAPS